MLFDYLKNYLKIPTLMPRQIFKYAYNVQY